MKNVREKQIGGVGDELRNPPVWVAAYFINLEPRRYYGAPRGDFQVGTVEWIVICDLWPCVQGSLSYL